MTESPREVLARARTVRVELGAFTAEELWRAGVPVPGVARRPDAPAAASVAGGAGTYRRLSVAPAPSLVAQVFEPDGESLQVVRVAELLEPDVAKVVEQRRGQDRYVLSVQPVPSTVAEVVVEAGAARPARVLCSFQRRFRWVETRGRFRRGTSWSLETEDLPPASRVFLDQRVLPGDPARVQAELSAEASRMAPGLAVGTTVGDVAPNVVAFAGSLWDDFAPGPEPVSG